LNPFSKIPLSLLRRGGLFVTGGEVNKKGEDKNPLSKHK
jgi:hypothetical protein